MNVIRTYIDQTFNEERYVVKCPRCGREYAKCKRMLALSGDSCSDARCSDVAVRVGVAVEKLFGHLPESALTAQLAEKVVDIASHQ